MCSKSARPTGSLIPGRMTGEGSATSLRSLNSRDSISQLPARSFQLARWAAAIERHYSERAGVATPMDIEFAKDGVDGRLFVVQARPETVHSARTAPWHSRAAVSTDAGDPGVGGSCTDWLIPLANTTPPTVLGRFRGLSTERQKTGW